VLETHGPGKLPFVTVGNAFQALESTIKNPNKPQVPNLEGSSVSSPDKAKDILDWNKPAGTIRCGGRAWHPTLDRAINVREAASLQSYPQYYEFVGSLTDQYKQVGNAVPGRMAKAVAMAIAESLRFVYAEEDNEEEKPTNANGTTEEADTQIGVAETNEGGMEIENESGSEMYEETKSPVEEICEILSDEDEQAPDKSSGSSGEEKMDEQEKTSDKESEDSDD